MSAFIDRFVFANVDALFVFFSDLPVSVWQCEDLIGSPDNIYFFV